MPVIDFRVRPPTGGFLGLILYTQAQRRDRVTRMHGFEPAPSAQAQSMPLLLEEMGRAKVTAGVMLARISDRLGCVDNDEVLRISREYAGRLIGIAAIDPTDRRKALLQIDDVRQAGFRAVNLEPGTHASPMYADDRRLYPIYGACEDSGLPIVIMAGGNAGPDLSNTEPIHIDRVAADFPALRIVVSHGGWPWVHAMLHIAFRRANVYLSPDQYLANMAGMQDYVRAADTFLAERFLYASSYPFLPVDAHLAWFRRLPIRPEAMDRVLWRNAAELLCLDVSDQGALAGGPPAAGQANTMSALPAKPEPSNGNQAPGTG